MSTNLEYRERQRQRKEKIGDRPAKINEKKSDGELERQIRSGEKMRNASGH